MNVAYADDEVIFLRGRSKAQLEERVSEVLNSTLQWCVLYKLHLSQDKSVGLMLKGPMLIGKCHRPRRSRIRMSGGFIRMVDEMRHLGIYWGEGMSVLPHLRDVRKKISRMGSELRCVAKAKWGLNHKSLAILNKKEEGAS